MLDHPHSESFLLLNGITCVSVCACFLLVFHWAPLQRVPPSSLLSLLCHKGMLLVYGQLVVHWGSRVFLCKAVFPASWLPTCTGTKGEGGLNKKGGRRENDKEKRVGEGVGGWECAEECRQLEPICWLQQAGLPHYNAIGGRLQS